MLDHSTLSCDRTMDQRLSRLESRISSLESAAQLAHEAHMRTLQEQTRESVKKTGFWEGVMASTLVISAVAVIILAVVRP